MTKKMYAPMWMVNEGLPNEAVYHYSDKERAKALNEGEVKEVYVAMNSDFFIGTWQFMDGLIAFDTEEEAQSYVNNYNNQNGGK